MRCRRERLNSEGEGAAFFVQGGDEAADLGGVQVFVLPAEEADEIGGIHRFDVEIAFALLNKPAGQNNQCLN